MDEEELTLLSEFSWLVVKMVSTFCFLQCFAGVGWVVEMVSSL